MSELVRLFAKLGLIAFGGPAAHIAMMEDEVVERRKWLSRQHFLDLIGATNLVPGPNSTEMTMHVGYERAGWKGLFAAGVSFITPAALLTLAAAWAYVEFGTLPAVEPVLAGIRPVVVAVILGALWRLGKKAVRTVWLGAVALGVGVAVWFGVNPVAALFAGTILGGLMALTVTQRLSVLAWPALVALQTADVPLWRIGAFFLKVGAVLYGSGYVLIAFLEADVVGRYGWLTQDQLLDAVALGQLTPGPVLTTATFIGYLLAGVPGALVATLGIFLPSFLFVWILNPLVPRLRESLWASAFLDAVNAAAVGLMAAVTLRLAVSSFFPDGVYPSGSPSWMAIGLFTAAAVAAIRFRVSTVWLVGLGAAVGYAVGYVASLF
ncbi:MAG: chromate efflux transporter [Bacteroidota bacterium]